MTRNMITYYEMIIYYDSSDYFSKIFSKISLLKLFKVFFRSPFLRIFSYDYRRIQVSISIIKLKLDKEMLRFTDYINS